MHKYVTKMVKELTTTLFLCYIKSVKKIEEVDIMTMNKKGFTLIELLAVIVILAVIALIATPLVMNVIEDARQGAAENSAYAFLDAAEDDIALRLVNGETFTFPLTLTDADTGSAAIEVKGTTPSAYNIVIGSDGSITSAWLVIDNRVIGYTPSTGKVHQDSTSS